MNAIQCDNLTDNHGNPTGGKTWGVGMTINWQDGPLGRDKDRKEPNGAFVEDVIRAAIDRLEFYQESKFRCKNNEDALFSLQAALRILEARTSDREARKVEGTHAV